MKLFQTILLVGFLFISNCSYSQYSIGFKAGYDDAWQDYGNVPLPPNAETHIKGYNISLEIHRYLNPYLSIGLEPGLVRRGAACVPGWNGGIVPVFEGDTKFLLNYLELPFSVSAKLPIFKTNFSLFAKSSFGAAYLIAAEQEKLNFLDGSTEKTKMELDKSSVLNRFDYGYYFGGGLAYQLKSHQIFFEYEAYRGLTDAEKFNASQNRNNEFSLGYRFLISAE